MTLDCKTRRDNPTVVTSSPARVSDMQNEGSRNISNQTQDRNISSYPTVSTSRRPKARESTGESFLQRLLEIERRHDERKIMRKKALKKLYPEVSDSVQDQNSGFPRSPTRWISDQIFDDTQDDFRDEERGHFGSNSFSKSSYSRLPSLSDVHRISPRAIDSSPSLSSQKQTDFVSNSLTNLSYVDLCQREDLQNLSQVRKRPLRLPPIFLPPIYAVRPRPLKERDFLTPTNIRGPITDEEWEDLHQCRYLRPAPPRFALPLSSSQMS